MSKKSNGLGSKVMSALQTFQPAIAPVIAVIPLAGLLMGLGTFLSNATFAEMYPILNTRVFSLLASLMKDSGQYILNNIGFMFAISVAMVYSGYEGFAGFSGGISYIVFMKSMGTILGITADTVAANKMTQTTVLGIPTLNTGVMGGIAVGLLAAWCYKRFHETRLPLALAFFQGKRTVPIMSILLSIVMGGVFSIVWPTVQTGIQASVGGMVNNENLLAICIMLFISRLLVPFGLHTLISMPIMYELGTYVNNAGDTVHGATNIYMAELADGGKWTDLSYFSVGTSVFSTVFMLVVAFAIIANAKPRYRKRTMGLFSAGIITTALTGISEPILFSYMFTCPPLFVLHSLFHGFAPMFAKFSGMHVGTGFCGGFMDFIVYGVLQGNQISHWMRGFIFIPLFGGICFVVCFLFIKVFHLHVPGNREGDFAEDEGNAAEYKLAGNLKLATQVISMLNGKDNIVSVDACATRLRVTVKNVDGIDKNAFNKLGAKGTMVMGNNLQIIFGVEAARIKEEVKAVLSGSGIVAVSDGSEIKEEISAPADGEMIPLSEVKDPTIASGLIGQGFAVEPENGKVYSPVNGTVESVFPTRHAISIKSDTGKDVLVHLGVDTVKMNGAPFDIQVGAGDLVSAGSEMGTMDVEAIRKAGYAATVCVLFTDLEGEVVKLNKAGKVKAGETEVAELEKK